MVPRWVLRDLFSRRFFLSAQQGLMFYYNQPAAANDLPTFINKINCTCNQRKFASSEIDTAINHGDKDRLYWFDLPVRFNVIWQNFQMLRKKYSCLLDWRIGQPAPASDTHIVMQTREGCLPVPCYYQTIHYLLVKRKLPFFSSRFTGAANRLMPTA